MEPLLKNNISSSSNRFQTNPNLDVEEASAASAFRRRNKILILVLLFLIVLLCIVVSVLIAYVAHNFRMDSSFLQPRVVVLHSRAVVPEFHATASNDTRILLPSLITAAAKLERFVSFLSGVGNAGDFVAACSNSSAEALRQIAGARESMSDDRRTEVVERMKAAAESLKSCAGALQGGAEATETVREAEAAVVGVIDRLIDGVRLVGMYDVVSEENENDVVSEEEENGVVLVDGNSGTVFGYRHYDVFWRYMVYENLFGIGMIALQLIYMFFLFWCLFRIR